MQQLLSANCEKCPGAEESGWEEVKDNEWVGHESGLEPNQCGIRREGGVRGVREKRFKPTELLGFWRRLRGL
jgi:hypothetical protein